MTTCAARNSTACSVFFGVAAVLKPHESSGIVARARLSSSTSATLTCRQKLRRRRGATWVRCACSGEMARW